MAMRKIQDYQHSPWLRPAEAAEYIGVSLSTIKRWLRDGDITARKVSPRIVLIDRHALDDWINQHNAPDNVQAIANEMIAKIRRAL